MQAKLLPGQVVEQLHFGGGTPTFLSDDEIRQLMAAIRQNFKLVDDGEYSIEIDPRRSAMRLSRCWFRGFQSHQYRRAGF